MRLWLPFITARRQRKANASVCAIAGHEYSYSEQGYTPALTYWLCGRCGHVEAVWDDGAVFDRYPCGPKTTRRVRRHARARASPDVPPVLFAVALMMSLAALVDFIVFIVRMVTR